MWNKLIPLCCPGRWYGLGVPVCYENKKINYLFIDIKCTFDINNLDKAPKLLELICTQWQFLAWAPTASNSSFTSPLYSEDQLTVTLPPSCPGLCVCKIRILDRKVMTRSNYGWIPQTCSHNNTTGIPFYKIMTVQSNKRPLTTRTFSSHIILHFQICFNWTIVLTTIVLTT